MKRGILAWLVVASLLVAAGPSLAHEGHAANPPAEGVEAPAPGPPPAYPWGHGFPGHFATWLGKLHPVAVHFPIALLLAAAAAEALLARRRLAWLAGAVRFCVAVGALLAVVAAALGWLSAGPITPEEDWLVAAHRWAGSATALLALGTLVASERGARSGERGHLRVALALVAAGVLATGFLGGSLVHGIDHLRWPTG